MKKSFIILALIAIGGEILAQDYSARITMKLSSINGASDKIDFYESSADFSDEIDNGYDGVKTIMNTEMMGAFNNAVDFYGVCSWGKATAVATSLLEGTKLAFISNKVDGDIFTITFSKATGIPYYLKDSKVQDAAGNDSLTAIVAGGTYSFTQAISTTEERFEIVKKPAEPAICHQYGNLIITGHKGAKVKVLDMADAVAIAETTLATDDEVISLSTLTKGEMYQVVMDEEVMLIRIQ